MQFSYQKCTTWLREKARELAVAGFKAEVKENAVPVQSFLLRISNSGIEAELVVWETGTTSMTVASLSTRSYVTDRSDVVLTNESFEPELDKFFEALK